MSTVYTVECLAVHGAEVTCRVRVVQVPQPLVPSKSFAFGFLWEGWHHAGWPPGWGAYIEWPGGSAEEGKRLAGAAAWAQELGDYCWYTAHQRDPRATQFVADVRVTELDDAQNNSVYLMDDDDGSQPEVSAVYAVTMTDARWVDWLRPGMTWHTVAGPPDAEYDREQWQRGNAAAIEEAFARWQAEADAAGGG